MTPSSSVPYMSTSQDVKSPFLPDLKPSVSSLHSSPPGECHLLPGQVGGSPGLQRVLQGTWGAGSLRLYLLFMYLFANLFKVWIFSLEKYPCTQNFVYNFRGFMSPLKPTPGSEALLWGRPSQ